MKILSLVFIFAFIGCSNDNDYKETLLNQMDDSFILSDKIVYLENIEGYYTDISFSLLSDSSYVMILWADRNSIWWHLRKDKIINVDVPYNRYKGKNVDLDIQLIKKFNNLKK